MHIYLPIAELSVDISMVLGLGAGIGLISGLFGAGGGFLLTPLLIFIGVPPAVAVGSGAAQIVASSVSGVLAHSRRGNVDFRMGGVLLAGGIVGSTAGVQIFGFLRSVGQVDLVIALSYVLILGTVGALMFQESLRALLRHRRTGIATRGKLHQHNFLHGLPLKMRFPKSKLYISSLLPLALGALVGLLAALMGVGGGFILVPAMIYVLGMPTSVVVGTSLFQIVFVSGNVTLLQAYQTQTVDIFLALLLVVGGVIGAQLGAKMGARLRGEQLRILMALMVLAVAFELAWNLVVVPADVFSLDRMEFTGSGAREDSAP